MEDLLQLRLPTSDRFPRSLCPHWKHLIGPLRKRFLLPILLSRTVGQGPTALARWCATQAPYYTCDDPDPLIFGLDLGNDIIAVLRGSDADTVSRSEDYMFTNARRGHGIEVWVLIGGWRPGRGIRREKELDYIDVLEKDSCQVLGCFEIHYLK